MRSPQQRPSSLTSARRAASRSRGRSVRPLPSSVRQKIESLVMLLSLPWVLVEKRAVRVESCDVPRVARQDAQAPSCPTVQAARPEAGCRSRCDEAVNHSVVDGFCPRVAKLGRA
jgi:hypothetical protein